MTAHVALFLPSLDGGGAERVFVGLANDFAARGLRVDLVLGMAQGAYLVEVSKNVKIVDLASARLLRALPKLTGYLRRERPDAILSGLDHANVVAIIARRLSGGTPRCVISTRSMPSEMFKNAASARTRMLFRFAQAAYGNADCVIANSQAVAQNVMLHVGVPPEKLKVIYNPINLDWVEAMSREPLEHEWFKVGAPPVVLSAGRLSAEKDFGTMIRAFAQIRRRRVCRLVILGDGPERANLAALARDEGVTEDMIMPGFVANPIAWMRRARVFASSSLTEGFPNVVMQALALGMPIVSTRSIGGTAELLGNGRWGRLVAVGEPGPMAQAIEESLDAGTSPEVRRRAQDFAHGPIASQYLEVLLSGRNLP